MSFLPRTLVPRGAAKRLSVVQPRALAISCAAALVLGSAAVSAPAQSPQLSAVLAQMDAGSKKFQSATASVERDFYEKVVHATTVQKGSVYFQRTGSTVEFGATVFDIGDNGKQAPAPSKILNYGGGMLRMYTPGVNQVDVFKSGANQAKYESYLTLGFGGSGHDLAQTWNITDGGPETLSDGGQQVKTEKLVLISKDPALQNTFRQVTIWVDPVRDVSLKQVFETPSGDRQTAIYSAIHLNGKVDKGAFTIPKKATVIQH